MEHSWHVFPAVNAILNVLMILMLVAYFKKPTKRLP